MNSNFTEIGIATAEGIFEGKNTTFVVEFFGKPSENKTEEKPIINKKIVVVENQKEVIPSVAGVSTENILSEDIKKESDIKIVEETKDFIVAQNENASIDENIEPALVASESKSFSTWYERFIINPTNIILIIYKIILGAVLLSTLLMLTKKYEKHHTKHLALSIILIILVATLLFFVSFK
jgi:hypothetical protein